MPWKAIKIPVTAVICAIIVTQHYPKLVIEAGRAEHQYWKDLWRYRELFYFLASEDQC